ncbi:MarR family winged helix-turn-helix transcriptional regulator [Desulfitobacterium sp. Sab5]|uniref:MarR family winged helix-turn-helix transcriptional regulator n=1 Tax=Desulfitobacterium nosdiversum TaxID=3375356 RepID=UPI003CF23271
MNHDNAKEIYDLALNFMGLFREKFALRSRNDFSCISYLKKNHIKILIILYKHEYITMTEIGKMLDIEKGSLTTLIDSLVENDFVNRSNDPNDRRKSLVSLSPHGREAADEVIGLYAQKVYRLLHEVDPEKLQKFMSSLKYVVGFMKTIE